MQQLTPVTGSSQVTGFAYDGAQRVLSVQFKNSGTVYQYQNVPPDVAAGFEAAESKGTFVGQHIKGKFDFTKVGAGETEAEGA